MKILTKPNPVLSKVCEPLSIQTVPMWLIDEMFDLMGDNLGLAANQIGICYRLFIMRPDFVFVNPEIMEASVAMSPVLAALA